MPPDSPAAPRAGADREKQVQQIFSEIAPRYDLLNHVLSLNVDRAWRSKAVDALGWETAPEGTYLDACAGTYDLALELCAREGFGGRVDLPVDSREKTMLLSPDDTGSKGWTKACIALSLPGLGAGDGQAEEDGRATHPREDNR